MHDWNLGVLNKMLSFIVVQPQWGNYLLSQFWYWYKIVSTYIFVDRLQLVSCFYFRMSAENNNEIISDMN